MNSEIKRCYQVLELEPEASLEEVRKARRKLAKVWHPDRFPGDPELQEKAQNRLKEINHAYSVLEAYLVSGTLPAGEAGDGGDEDSASDGEGIPPAGGERAEPDAAAARKRAFAIAAVLLVLIVGAVVLLNENEPAPDPVDADTASVVDVPATDQPPPNLPGSEATTTNQPEAAVTDAVDSQAGQVDPSFDPGSGANGWVECLAIQEDGRILIGGDFTRFNGTARTRIARLLPDGSVDDSFDPGEGANSHVRCMALQEDGRILIAGDFTSFAGTRVGRVARLEPDGSLDPSFNPGSGANNIIFCLDLSPRLNPEHGQPIVIGGRFTKVSGRERIRIARLNADGTLDPEFHPGSGPASDVLALAVQADRRVVVAGSFGKISEQRGKNIARLLPNGVVDSTFGAARTSDPVYALAAHPDGRTLIAGQFRRINGMVQHDLGWLSPTGQRLRGMNPGPGVDKPIRSAAVQPDGKIIIAGDFTTYSNYPRNRIARVNPDGSLDGRFNPGTGATHSVFEVALQPDGKIIAVGGFTNFNQVATVGIVRLYGDESRAKTPHAQKPEEATRQSPWVNSLGMRFVPLSGTDILLSIWETRRQDYEAYAEANSTVGHEWRQAASNSVPVGHNPDHPVVMVSHGEARAFCRWLTDKERREGLIAPNQAYRLPSDQEWSRAVGLPPEAGSTPKARDGLDRDQYPWGAEWPPPVAAGNYSGKESVLRTRVGGYSDGFATTAPVGSFRPNTNGIYDLGGNVLEWCEDWYSDLKQHRVYRGGSWRSSRADLMLSSYRAHNPPGDRHSNLGFRLVLARVPDR